MFGIGLPELMIILVLALVVIGPKKMPDVAKALGRGLNEFRRASQEIKNTINLDPLEPSARERTSEPRHPNDA